MINDDENKLLKLFPALNNSEKDLQENRHFINSGMEK